MSKTGMALAHDHLSCVLYVDDVDRTFERLRTFGAAVVAEPQDQPWGRRVARILDPAVTSCTSVTRLLAWWTSGRGRR